MSWRFTLEKISGTVSTIRSAIVRSRISLDSISLSRDIMAEPKNGDASSAKWEPFGISKSYSAREEIITIKAKAAIPEKWAGQRVYIAAELIQDNGEYTEGLVYIDGKAVQAIDNCHHSVLLTGKAEAGKAYEIAIAAYSGIGNNRTVSHTDPLVTTLKTLELQWIDRDLEEFYYDLKVALDCVKVIDNQAKIYHSILNALDETTNLLNLQSGVNSDAFRDSVTLAALHLKEQVYDKFKDNNLSPVAYASGHAHLDTAWLWRIAHTRRKAAHTFTTALALMDEYPDFHFTCSQAQQYAYIKEEHPATYERIKAAVKTGNWEPAGGMWVESDCNIPSGESLVRQFLHGIRYFEKEFGTRPKTVWLPDVFGYSGALPQIFKKAGMQYFMTIKIAWNQTNSFPYQTFVWEGIDGSRILTHFSPLGDYNAQMTPEQLDKNWKKYQQKNISDSVLYIYGNGDGGGGVTREMLETAKRLTAFPGIPSVVLSKADDFFTKLDKEVAAKPHLPRWVGELYLEYHRGSYTSQANNKRSNRLSEILLQTAEQLSLYSNLLSDQEYPQEELNQAWQKTLLNQFHDIIPGSSIHEVYEDSARDYAEIIGSSNRIIDSALQNIAGMVESDPGDVVVYNPLSWSRADIAELPGTFNVPGQNITDMDGESKILVELPPVPSFGYTTIKSGETSNFSGLRISKDALENPMYKISLDANGEIVSIRDKWAEREILDTTASFKGNALQAFEDRPMSYDAWDIDIFYQDKMYPVQELESIEVVEEGPIRGTVEIVRKFGNSSKIRQRISIYRQYDRIDFDTEVEWNERQTLLKVAFPVAVRTHRATYDIQFGNIERPTHWNTSWDWAKFETCGHKWADLSEGDFGVAVLTDSKYGWDIRDNVMRLSLLKAAIDPDPEADLGKHRFRYALFPHRGDWRSGGVVQRAYEFNVPVRAATITSAQSGDRALIPVGTLLSVDQNNIIVETVKKAEDDDSIIVRLYECYGQRGSARITFQRAVKSAVEVNLLEEETEETKQNALNIHGGDIGFTFLPYEIKTFKIQLHPPVV